MNLNRRDVGKSILGSLAVMLGLGRREPIESHYYAWRDGPVTTDPRCTPLQYGEASPQIMLDGVELPLGTPITRCVSGENGFVEMFDEADFKRALAIDPCVVYNADGTKNPHPLDDLSVKILRGRVEVLPQPKAVGVLSFSEFVHVTIDNARRNLGLPK